MTWFLSFIGVVLLWLYGDKSKYAPPFGIFVQVTWGAYAIVTEQYGLLAGNLVFALVHLRNWRLWSKA